jgi:lysozyme
MDASERCIGLIHGSEGFHTKLPDGRYKSYLDKLPKVPVWTIYCGLTKGVGANTVWTVEQCEKAFSKEMAFYEDAIERMVTVPLNQNQFDALVSLVYNIGPGSPTDPDKRGFYWSTLRKLLNQGKYAEAATQFARYKYSGGKVYPGLVKRRAKEAALFMEPVAEEGKPEEIAEPLPQTVDVGPVMTTTEAIKTSPTTQLTVGSIILMVYSWGQSAVDFALGVVKEAGPQIIETQKDLSPFSAIMSTTGGVAVAIALGCLAAAAIRQIVKRREGTSV